MESTAGHLGNRFWRPVPALLAVALVGAGPASADIVADMNAVGARTIVPPPGVVFPAITPEEQRSVVFVDLATMHLAMYDAVVAIAGGFEPYAVTPDSPAAGASQTAAAGAAGCAVLAGLFPNRAAQYAADCAPFQPGAGADESVNKGIALGIEVGQKMLAERADDGRDTTENYAPSGEIGHFAPSAPGNPTLHFAPYMRPFTLSSIQQFRANGPPDLTSASYAEDLEEVMRLGRAGGAELDAGQQDIARFHTENPNVFWPRNLRPLLSRPTVLENARLAAMLWTAFGDAIIACFESKYFYDAWRPRTAIPMADGDGNPATTADPTWAPFVGTPNHPEYPAAHACGGGVVAEVLKSHFKSPRVNLSWTSSVTGSTHEFDSVYDMVRELKVARIYGGMHFRYSSDDGATLGKRVGQWVTQNYFEPTDKKH
jgi:hypothetical protein